MDDLKARSISAVIWGAGGTLLRILVQIVAQIIMARLLGPEQFGLFATALVVLFFANLFADAGLAYGLVQQPTVSEENIRVIFTWQMAIAIVVAAALALGAPAIAAAFGESRLTSVLHWLAVSVIITTAGGVSATILRRRLDFQTLNVAAVASYAVAFFGVGIPMALAGYGVMALVSAFLLHLLIQSSITYWYAYHSVRPLLWDRDAPGLLKFGANVFATNIINWVMSSLDRAIVSAMLGATAAGLYSTIQNAINVPAQSAVGAIQPVIYSASSRLQGNTRELKRGLCAMLAAVFLFAGPVFVAIAIIAQTFILALYGPKWLGGEAILAPLALAVPAVILMGVSTPVLWNAGYPRKEFQVQVPMAFVWAILCVLAARYGSVVTVSWIVFAMLLVRAGTIIWLTMRAVDLSPTDASRLLRPGLIVTAVVALTAALADHWFLKLGFAPLARLSVVILCCAVAMMSTLRSVHPMLPDDLMRWVKSATARLPLGTVRDAMGYVLGV